MTRIALVASAPAIYHPWLVLHPCWAHVVTRSLPAVPPSIANLILPLPLQALAFDPGGPACCACCTTCTPFCPPTTTPTPRPASSPQRGGQGGCQSCLQCTISCCRTASCLDPSRGTHVSDCALLHCTRLLDLWARTRLSARVKGLRVWGGKRETKPSYGSSDSDSVSASATAWHQLCYIFSSYFCYTYDCCGADPAEPVF